MVRLSKQNRLAKLLPLLLVAGLALAGCSPAPAVEVGAKALEPGSVAAQEPGVLTLGVLGPFTGPSQSTGQEFRGAVTMAFDAINWQIGDYTIEVVWIDSQSDPETAAQAYEQAVVEQGIQAGILNWHSSVAVECMEVASQYQIPHIFPYGATEEVNEKFHTDPDRYDYWMNKGWPVPEKLTVAYVQALEDAIGQGLWKPEEKTVALLAENTHWGRSFVKAIKQQLEAAGWTSVAEDYFNLDEVEFHPLLNKLKAQEVALIASTSTSLPSFAALINQADEVGIESLLIADGLGWAGEWYQMTGESSNYVIDQIPVWATAEGEAFAAQFEQRWGTKPSPSAAGLAYDGANMFIEIAAQALAESGELSSETIYHWAKEKLQTGKWSYTGGIVMEEYLYTPDTLPDPVVGEGYYTFPVLQYAGGEGRVIYPPQWADQPLQAKP